jgi:hypothetical protein
MRDFLLFWLAAWAIALAPLALIVLLASGGGGHLNLFNGLMLLIACAWFYGVILYAQVIWSRDRR